MGNADSAMYQAKELGRNNFRFFTPELNERALVRASMETQIRHALERNEFELCFQPMVDLRSGEMVRAEALLRWHSPELGTVGPDQFIPVAEEIGLIAPIGEWVLKTACRQAQKWIQDGLTPARISVNVSSRQFRGPALLEAVSEILEDTRIDPAYLELEITENLLMADIPEIKETLESLRLMGISLSVDDFGTGYSSLSYLRRFPVNVLKIDKIFVQDATADPDSAALVEAIINMARSLNLDVVAEGVETDAQMEFLRSHDCDYAQGYYFSKPLPGKDFAKLMETWQPSTFVIGAGASTASESPLLEGPVDHIGEKAHDLGGRFRHRQGRRVHFLQRVIDRRIVQGDDRLADAAGIARVERGVPLFVLVAEAHHDHVRTLDQGAGADGVDHRPLVILPVGVRFLAQDVDAAVVAGVMIGNGGQEFDRQAGFGHAFLDLLAPIGMDLAGQVNGQAGSGHSSSFFQSGNFGKVIFGWGGGASGRDHPAHIVPPPAGIKPPWENNAVRGFHSAKKTGTGPAETPLCGPDRVKSGKTPLKPEPLHAPSDRIPVSLPSPPSPKACWNATGATGSTGSSPAILKAFRSSICTAARAPAAPPSTAASSIPGTTTSFCSTSAAAAARPRMPRSRPTRRAT